MPTYLNFIYLFDWRVMAVKIVDTYFPPLLYQIPLTALYVQMRHATNIESPINVGFESGWL